MKYQRNFLHAMRQHGKRIVTTTLLACVLALSWNAAEAQPSAVADGNGDEYDNLSVSVPAKQISLTMLSRENTAPLTIGTYPAKVAKVAAIQLFSDMPMESLKANASVPTLLLQHASHLIGKHESGVAADDDGFLVMFSW